MSSMNDAATCTTMSALRMLCRLCVDAAAVAQRRRDPTGCRRAPEPIRRPDPSATETSERVEQDRSVDADLGGARREALGERDQQIQAPARERQAEQRRR